LPDESFSSWFYRLSYANGLTPSELYRIALPGAFLHSRDLDRLACINLLTELSERTAVPIQTLEKLTFSAWGGTVFADDDGRGRLAWLPAAGRVEHKKSFGQQYCPRCLISDSVPYLRRTWRLGFVSICAEHRTVLCDRCPNCAEPIQPLKLIRKSTGFGCSKCCAALASANLVPAWGEDLRYQKNMLRAATEGWMDLPGWGPIHAVPYFRLVAILFRLLAAGGFAKPLRYYLALSMEERYETAQIPVVKDVELLPPERRVQLLRQVGRLLENWPKSFIDACKNVGASPRHLIKDAQQTPFAFWDPVVRELSGSLRRIDDEEAREGADYLRRRGIAPTRNALTDLLKVKAASIERHAEPASSRTAYGKGRYWKLDSVAPEVRQAVLLAAHREGENIAGWVEKALRTKLQDSGFVIPSSDLM
jgi:hypothetical protein